MPCQTCSSGGRTTPLLPEVHDADYSFIEDELADLSHEWWFSATRTRYVRRDTYLVAHLFHVRVGLASCERRNSFIRAASRNASVPPQAVVEKAPHRFP